MRYVVGITLDRRDRDAVSLALTLARSVVAPHSVAIELVHVIRGPQPDHAQSAQEREFQQLRKDSALEGLAKVSDLIPKSIRSTVTVHFAESMAEGLLEIASTGPCDLIIVGAASRGPFRRFTVGSVANALLHSASVPVALAPSGYLPPSRLTRLTCAMEHESVPTQSSTYPSAHRSDTTSRCDSSHSSAWTRPRTHRTDGLPPTTRERCC